MVDFAEAGHGHVPPRGADPWDAVEGVVDGGAGGGFFDEGFSQKEEGGEGGVEDEEGGEEAPGDLPGGGRLPGEAEGDAADDEAEVEDDGGVDEPFDDLPPDAGDHAEVVGKVLEGGGELAAALPGGDHAALEAADGAGVPREGFADAFAGFEAGVEVFEEELLGGGEFGIRQDAGGAADVEACLEELGHLHVEEVFLLGAGFHGSSLDAAVEMGRWNFSSEPDGDGAGEGGIVVEAAGGGLAFVGVAGADFPEEAVADFRIEADGGDGGVVAEIGEFGGGFDVLDEGDSVVELVGKALGDDEGGVGIRGAALALEGVGGAGLEGEPGGVVFDDGVACEDAGGDAVVDVRLVVAEVAEGGAEVEAVAEVAVVLDAGDGFVLGGGAVVFAEDLGDIEEEFALVAEVGGFPGEVEGGAVGVAFVEGKAEGGGGDPAGVLFGGAGIRGEEGASAGFLGLGEAAEFVGDAEDERGVRAAFSGGGGAIDAVADEGAERPLGAEAGIDADVEIEQVVGEVLDAGGDGEGLPELGDGAEMVFEFFREAEGGETGLHAAALAPCVAGAGLESEFHVLFIDGAVAEQEAGIDAVADVRDAVPEVGSVGAEVEALADVVVVLAEDFEGVGAFDGTVLGVEVVEAEVGFLGVFHVGAEELDGVGGGVGIAVRVGEPGGTGELPGGFFCED